MFIHDKIFIPAAAAAVAPFTRMLKLKLMREPSLLEQMSKSLKSLMVYKNLDSYTDRQGREIDVIMWVSDGIIWHHLKGNMLSFHREDGPAIQYTDGSGHWYKEGKLHRDDGPAMVDKQGKEYWFKEGEPYEPSAHDLMVWKMNEKERTAH